MSATARMPTSRVPTIATTWRSRRTALIALPRYVLDVHVRRARARAASARCDVAVGSSVESEGLADAEVEPEPAGLRLAIDHQPGNRVQLIAEIGAERADRRVVANARTDVVAQIVEIEVPGSAQTLPPSRKMTPPRLLQMGTRSSAEKFMSVWPPIGRPPRSAARPRIVPSRAGSWRRRGNSAWRTAPSSSVSPVPSIEPARPRTATTALLAM